MATVVVHLTSSTFFGGPERQMLGLARALPAEDRTVFLSFLEGGRCQGFLDEARRQGFEAEALAHDTPQLRSAITELARRLREVGAHVLCVHGYKAGLLGHPAARRVGIPVVGVSRGWTAESVKVRLYEALDKLNLRRMDRVVCVSEGQAAKVRRLGVPAGRILVIPNAIDPGRFQAPEPSARQRLAGLFAEAPAGPIVGAAGRLSPEKGFGVLIEAAARVHRAHPTARFVVFGAGGLRAALTRQIARLGLDGRFVLAGFRADLDELLPSLDLMVLPSFTEGLPNVILEASAAGVSVVATAVGGTPEAVLDGSSGFLVPPGDPDALSRRILELLGDPARRYAMGRQGRRWVRDRFSFETQAIGYLQLFGELTAPPTPTPIPGFHSLTR